MLCGHLYLRFLSSSAWIQSFPENVLRQVYDVDIFNDVIISVNIMHVAEILYVAGDGILFSVFEVCFLELGSPGSWFGCGD